MRFGQDDACDAARRGHETDSIDVGCDSTPQAVDLFFHGRHELVITIVARGDEGAVIARDAVAQSRFGEAPAHPELVASGDGEVAPHVT